MYDIYIESYGCSANQNNGEIISGLLTQAGLNIVDNIEIADIIIINTCIVKGPTLSGMITRVEEVSKKDNKTKIIVAGCLPDIPLLAKKIKKISPKISLVGSHHFKEMAKIVKEIVSGKTIEITDKKAECRINVPKKSQSKIIGITQISEGCLGECSFCITRRAKGKLFSYPQEDIIKNVKQDLEAGCKEIWLTSQDNGAYGLDRGKRELPKLLKKVLELKGKFFVRLGMMNPNNVLPIIKDLVEIYKNKKMFKFIHIPLQSGSDKVLESMKRKYSSEDFLKIVEKFKKEIPEITISTDIIYGYPNEQKEDFEKTIEIMKKVNPLILHRSRFWPMPNTPAARMNQLSSEICKERGTLFLEEHLKIALEYHKKLVGKEVFCLIDKKGFGGTWLARDENYRLIVVNSNEKILGNIVKVKIKDTKPHYLLGEIIK